MSSRSNLPLVAVAICTFFAPLVVALSAVPESGRTLAVMLPPWMGADAQLESLAQTGVALRDGGGRMAGLGPRVWLVQVPDPQSGERLKRLPALLMSASLAGCGIARTTSREIR